MWAALAGLLALCSLSVAQERPDWFDECEGFGCAVVEIYNHSSCIVSSLEESAFVSCLEKEWTHITFDVSGTIVISEERTAPRGTIIDGSGQDITFTGWDIFLTYYTIVYQVSFDTGFEDALCLRGDWVSPMGDVWIHHCTFTNYDDGLVDVTRGFSRVTISWSYFYNHDKTNLISQDEDDVTTDQVTMHHNFFYECVQRMPRVRYAHVHVYNNIYESLGLYGIRSSQLARVLVENCVFLPNDQFVYECITVQPLGNDTENGYLRHIGNYFTFECLVEDNAPETVPDVPYQYQMQPADDDLVEKVKNGAGSTHHRHKRLFPKHPKAVV